MALCGARFYAWDVFGTTTIIMGVSTNGQICYGLLFDEDYELPWNTREYDHDIETWWQKVAGFKPDFCPWLNHNYAPGIKRGDPRIDIYYEQMREWNKANPLPVELVNCCSGDYPIWILAVRGTVQISYRGDPQEVKPMEPNVVATAAAVAFCDRYGIEHDGDFKWWLSSYYG